MEGSINISKNVKGGRQPQAKKSKEGHSPTAFMTLLTP